jgi:hypothetical protein
MKQNHIWFGSLLIAAFLITPWAVPEPVTAKKPEMYTHVYLQKNAKLYDAHSEKKKPVGTLKAGQYVLITDADQTSYWDDSPQWIKVRTWLGDKWTRYDYKSQLTGLYDATDRTITTMFNTVLYDRLGGTPTTLALKPQKLRVSASFTNVPASAANATSLMLSIADWYEIDTWAGKKWLRDPALKEQIQSVSYQTKLTGTEIAYHVPSQDVKETEELAPQVVQVTGEWTFGAAHNSVSWLRVQLAQGERWISPLHPVWKHYRVTTETFTLKQKTAASSYSHPSQDGIVHTPDVTLQPGTYEAFEASGDYYHIHTDKGDLWVKPGETGR